MRKKYCTPEIIVIATAELCWTENPLKNSVEHGSAKDFFLESEENEDYTFGLNWDLWDTNDILNNER